MYIQKSLLGTVKSNSMEKNNWRFLKSDIRLPVVLSSPSPSSESALIWLLEGRPVLGRLFPAVRTCRYQRGSSLAWIYISLVYLTLDPPTTLYISCPKVCCLLSELIKISFSSFCLSSFVFRKMDFNLNHTLCLLFTWVAHINPFIAII